MLVLWDIDGTLLSSEGTGARGIEIAGRELFGAEFTLAGIELGGRLDPLILRDVFAMIGIEDSDTHHATYRARYHDILKEILAGEHGVQALDGAVELLDRLAEVPGVTQALVTGNYEETARLKLQAAGIDPDRFAFGVYGDEGEIRHDLPPLALTRYQEQAGTAPSVVVLLGDTEHDITSGQAAGCRVLAVCTGSHDKQRLLDAGADLVLDDLSEVDAVLSWMFSHTSEPEA